MMMALPRASFFRASRVVAPASLCGKRSASCVPERSAQYAQVNDSDIEAFTKILGTGGVITDAHELTAYNEDWMRKYHGHSKVALRPKTTEHVSAILKHCNQRKLAVVPQGGNTGLVGGSVPVHDEVVMSLGRMNEIISLDSVSGTVVCQAGVILQSLEAEVNKHDYTVPLDLGAKGSCQIGGNLSTNAGGLRVLRYGSLHGSCLGLQAVLADGTILDNLTTLRKDNTGYDLKHLFIGAEGTLGIITAVSMLLPPLSKSVKVAFLAVPSFKQVEETFRLARTEIGEILSAFEFLDRRSLDMVLRHQPGTRDPFAEESPMYLLVETSGSNAEHDEAKVSSFLEKALESGLVSDGTLAQDHAQLASLWRLRESISESLQKEAKVYKYDLSLPLDHFYKLVEIMRERMGDGVTVVGFGHVGDCNLHLNILAPTYDPKYLNLIEPFVYEYVAKCGGSISAEHGIGVMKTGQLHFSKSEAMIAQMRAVKRLFDPNAILNPYKCV